MKSKFMKRSSIILLFLLSLFSCQKLNEELDKVSSNIDLLEEQTISAINEQITSINQDISALHSVQSAFQSEISSLKKDVAELETAMQTLRNERSRLLDEIEKLEEDAASARDDISDASSNINNNISNLKDAINKQLNELRSRVSSIEAQIDSLQQQDSRLRAEVELLTNKDKVIQESITALQGYVDKEIKEFSDAAAATYMTLEHYNSVIEQLSGLKTEIATWHTEIHSALDSAIAEVSNSLDYIEERTAAMEQLVESIVNGVESLIYIPIHEDGRATLYFSNEQGVITNSYAVLDFTVHPASAATELAIIWNKVLSVKAMYAIPTMDTSTIPITSVSANDGVITIVVDGSTLNESVYHEESTVSLRLEVANSGNTITSRYIGLKRCEIGNITIPDTIFKAYLVDNFDSDGDGEISKSEAAGIMKIDVNGMSIASLEGIDYCTNLKSLKCSNTQIQHLKLDELTDLTVLDCANTPIVSLDVLNLEKLKALDCSNTQITNLDMLNLVNLEMLDGSNTKIQYLNLEKQINLTTLDCSNTKIQYLNLEKQINLTTLDCSNNAITNLDVLNLANLEILDCSNTKIPTFDCRELSKLTTLNISDCKELATLDCSNCALRYLDVSNNTFLQKINVADNPIEHINLDNCAALEYLALQCVTTNAISDTKISIDNYTQSTTLYFTANSTPFTSFTVKNTLTLTSLELYGEFTDITVTDNTALTSLVFYAPVVNATISGNSVLESVDVSALAGLQTLDVQMCKLQSLDVTKNLALTSLICSENELTSLDVSNNIALVKFYCNKNKLPKINVTANTALKVLTLSDNLLSTINIHNNTALTKLDVSNNADISTLNVQNNTALEELYCNGLAIGELNIVNNTTLTKLECHTNPNLTTLTCANDFDFTKTHISVNKGLVIIGVNGSVLMPEIGELITVNLGTGVVFYNDGKVVKLVSVEEPTLTWSTEYVTTNARNADDGVANMATIKAINPDLSKYPAFKWCADYGTGWYLPSRSEMEQVANQKTIINETLSACGFTTIGTYIYTNYWTSTEYNSDAACGLYWYGDSANFFKENTFNVRAVYAF